MHDAVSLLLAALVFPGGLFALALGLALKGVDRRIAARLQRRVGPPLAQPFFDLVKLMRKETLLPAGGERLVFLWAPAVGLASMALAAAMIPIAGIYEPPAALGDMLVLFYLLAVPAVVLMLAGSASGSPFGAIGFSREMAMILAYEGPILLVLISVALRVGAGEGRWISFSLAEVVRYQQIHGPFLLDPWMWPALATFLVFFPANLGIVPFDIPEAEAEVLDGPLLEYSGPSLGLFKMMSAAKSVVVFGLGIALFLPNGPAGLAGLLLFVLKCLVLAVFGMTVVRTAMGRMRIDQAFFFFLKWPGVLGVASLAIVLAGL